MSQLTKHNLKLWSRTIADQQHFLIWCPGCGHAHLIPSPLWNFDGNLEAPTFRPSVRIYITHPNTEQQETLCHFHVTGGKIEYCGDCKHAFNGKTIDMAEIPPDYGF